MADPSITGWRIHPDEILRYLLSDTTPVGASKNRFFRGAGYSPRSWHILEAALSAHPAVARLHKPMTTIHGERRIFRCNMPVSPNGRTYCILTVWERRFDGAFWLVTAYPQNG